MKNTHLLALGVVVIAAAVAGMVGSQGERGAAPAVAEPTPSAEPTATASSAAALPPGHPAIGRGANLPVADNSAGALTWKAPARFREAKSPSRMRLATYKVAHGSEATEDAEMSVIRAGGSTDANLKRWVGQFAEGAKVTRSERTVHGLHVAVLEVRGTYLGGMMMPGAQGGSSEKPDWALLGAVVETPGTAHFFKLTGPDAVVMAARDDFDALLGSVALK